MPRKSVADAAETRRTILDQARRLFSEKGFSGTSTSEIAASAKVTEGALFHHFKTKRAVFEVLWTELQLEMDAAAKAAAASASKAGGDGVAAFLAGCRTFFDFAVRQDFKRIVLVDGPRLLGDADWHEKDAGLGLPTVSAALEYMMAEGLIRRRPARPMAILVLGALNEGGFALARHEPEITPSLLLDAVEEMIR